MIKHITRQNVHETLDEGTHNYPSDFAKLINNKYIAELENMLAQKCIKDDSLYDKCKKINKNGLNICVLEKGTPIYKLMSGYVTEDMNNKYLRNNLDELSWFGNKYLPYTFVVDTFCGINVYVPTEDIYLFDYFDQQNLDKLLKFIETRYGIKSREYESIMLYTGYKLTKTEQYKQLQQINKKWNELWIYDEPILLEGSMAHCKMDEDDKLNPASRMKGIYFTDKILLKSLFNTFFKMNNIDGIIRKQIRTTIEVLGFTKEELIIPNKNILSKFMIDIKDPLYWKNMHFDVLDKYKIYDTGFLFSIPLSELLGKNKNFRLLSFYFDNRYTNDIDYAVINATNYVLSYNVHSWRNLNGMINDHDNFIKIVELLLSINASIVTMQEVDHLKENNYLTRAFDYLGYKHQKFVKNGAPKHSKKDSYLIVVSKNKIDNLDIIDTTVDKYKRNCIVCSIKNVKYCFVHLEIGERYHDRSNANDILNKNINLRKKQLDMILNKHNDIDVIMGDFNFSYDDEEVLWLQTKKFMLIDDKINTTPFNRTDLTFINNKFMDKYVKNYTIKCNYSDHLPVVSVFK